ncbi:MAG: 50S ribosomal protein L35 [Deferribacteraceae bacterium]|nr:50S ribosomal protein L35 [Deferribacteraceae bacterium]
MSAKMKTHKGSQKRFKVTANGKVLFGRATKRHKLISKSAKRKRGLRGAGVAFETDAARIKQIMPYA